LARTRIRNVFVAALLLAGLEVRAEPVPPCGALPEAIVPGYSESGDRPSVRFWHDVDLPANVPCLANFERRAKLAVALAARFHDTLSFEDIAGRVGAISSTKGTRYWSVSDGEWRTLVSEAFALASPDPGTGRADFTSSEILSGRTLYFAQRDTRSTTLNVYGLTGRMLGPRRLTIEIVNLSEIRFLLFTLFKPKSLRSLHIFEKLGRNDWGYYGLSTVREGSVEGHEKSFINRAAAAYRYFRGVPTDGDPPLAP
jgi:hypothetical protein